MTEPHHEPSYYEIALTNRQVVVAFVVLLVCLLAAFFSGVWIGRGSADRNAGEPQVARLAPPQPTEGRSLEELKFFSEESGSKRRGKGRNETASAPAPAAAPSPSPAPSAAPPPIAPSPAAEETAAAPPPRRTPPPAPEPDEGTAPARRAPAPPRLVDRTADRVASASPPDSGSVVRSRPLPGESAAGDSEAGAGRAADARPGGGSTVIQVFASADSNEARKVRDRLAHGGERAFLSPLTVDGRTMYRVRVGPFASRTLAQKEADRVRRSYKLDTWLTE